MVFDGYTLRCLTIELRKSLINGRIEKIYQPRRDTLLFHLRTGNGRERLLLSANPSNPRVHLTIEGLPERSTHRCSVCFFGNICRGAPFYP
ncbi:MAG: NFACT family protein [Bacillota bacterium]